MTKEVQGIIDNNSFYGLSSPEDIRVMNIIGQIQLLISEIEDKFRRNSFLQTSESINVSIDSEKYSKDVRDAVCELYVRKGWTEVTSQTSSENGERPGLTGFKFYI